MAKSRTPAAPAVRQRPVLRRLRSRRMAGEIQDRSDGQASSSAQSQGSIFSRYADLESYELLPHARSDPRGQFERVGGGDQCLRRRLPVMTVAVDNPANPFTFGLAEARQCACLGLVEGPSAVRKYALVPSKDCGVTSIGVVLCEDYLPTEGRLSSRCTSASAMKQRTWSREKQPNTKTQTQGRRDPGVAMLLLRAAHVGD